MKNRLRNLWTPPNKNMSTNTQSECEDEYEESLSESRGFETLEQCQLFVEKTFRESEMGVLCPIDLIKLILFNTLKL